MTISTSSSAPLNVTATDVVLIAAGTFTGGLNSFPAGAVICVASGAVFQPAYLNNAAGRVLNAGTATPRTSGPSR